MYVPINFLYKKYIKSYCHLRVIMRKYSSNCICFILDEINNQILSFLQLCILYKWVFLHTSHSLMVTIRPSGRPAVTTVNVVFFNVHVPRCLSKRMDHWTSGTVRLKAFHNVTIVLLNIRLLLFLGRIL
jgi:hypothetical protein